MWLERVASWADRLWGPPLRALQSLVEQLGAHLLLLWSVFRWAIRPPYRLAVLLEAMVNETPWIAHATGGVAQLGAFGQTYRSDAELRGLLADFSPDPARIARARDHAIGAHDIRATLHDIEAAARHAAAEPSAPPARTIAWLRALRGAWRGA